MFVFLCLCLCFLCFFFFGNGVVFKTQSMICSYDESTNNAKRSSLYKFAFLSFRYGYTSTSAAYIMEQDDEYCMNLTVARAIIHRHKQNQGSGNYSESD